MEGKTYVTLQLPINFQLLVYCSPPTQEPFRDRSLLDTSVAVCLSETESSMAVAGASCRLEYGNSMGAAAAFHSQAVHATAAADDGTKKIVFFFGTDLNSSS